jgi:hypothetical protein
MAYSYDRTGSRREDWVVSPDRILDRAVSNKLITREESHSRKFQDAAEMAAEELRDHWPEGEGFGSSDMTYVIRDMLENAGIKTEFSGYKLVRKDQS